MARVGARARRRAARLSVAMHAARAQARRRLQRELHLPVHVRSTKPFRFDACLRIAGVGERHDEIARATGFVTARSHRKGEPNTIRKRPWPEDLWLLESPLGEGASLNEHVNWLWNSVKPHRVLFAELIAQATWADVCLGCLSESAWPVIGVTADSLEMTRELRIGVSFNFTCL